MTSPEDDGPEENPYVTRDPEADDGRGASQEEVDTTIGLGLWHGLKADPPGPLPEHPTPVSTSRDRDAAGAWMARTNLRGWSTLAHRIGPGWTLIETHAVGFKAQMVAWAPVGRLVETIAVRARHAEDRACAVAFLEREVDPESPLETSVAEHRWKFSNGIAWVECQDPECELAGTPHPGNGRMTRIGARGFTAAVTGRAPLVEDPRGGLMWPQPEEKTTDEGEAA